MLASLLGLIVFIKYPLFVGIERQYGYAGIGSVVASVMTFVLFEPFSIKRCPDFIRGIIRYISKYTMGIYFVHRMVGTLLYKSTISGWLGMGNGSLYDCTVIFTISLFAVVLLERIPIRAVRDSVA